MKALTTDYYYKKVKPDTTIFLEIDMQKDLIDTIALYRGIKPEDVTVMNIYTFMMVSTRRRLKKVTDKWTS